MAFFNYPLNLRFKLVALSPQIIVTDASEREVMYVHQKVFNIREDIRVFSDTTRSQEIFRINTERILDLNSKYKFTNQTTGQYLGHVRPRALRSIWRATYLVYDENDVPQHHIREDNPWVKVLDSIVGQIDYVNWFTGFFLNPTYTIYRGDNREDISTPLFHLKKRPAFFEGVFIIEQVADVTPAEEARIILASMLMIQFMRRRG
jgi:phage-related protein